MRCRGGRGGILFLIIFFIFYFFIKQAECWRALPEGGRCVSRHDWLEIDLEISAQHLERGGHEDITISRVAGLVRFS